MPNFGAFVVSLDFEQRWGVRDHCEPKHGCHERLLGARDAVRGILDLFEQYEIAATWAVVGFLFARSRQELESFSPRVRPRYRNAALDPYGEQIGCSEEDDPLHFAPSMIRAIQARPRQEIGSHTFSHYYCQEPGQDKAAFAADMESAARIAGNFGVRLESIVFPRDQMNLGYRDVLKAKGITAYRGNQALWIYRPAPRRTQRSWVRRGARLFDAYIPLSGLNLCRWDEIAEDDGLCNVRASAYLRPYCPALRGFDALRLRRIAAAIKEAALSKRIFHLWWHPHDFGKFAEQNLEFLRAVLNEYGYWRNRVGMRSLNIEEVAALVRPA